MPFQSALPLQEAGHRRRNLRFALVAANVAVLLLLALLAFLVLRENRNAYDARARDTAQAMATIAQANVESELSRIDVLMRLALDELATARVPGPENDAAINRSLAAYQRLLPGVEGLRWADAEGALRWGNDLPPGAAIDVSDRAYFQRARAQPWTPDPLLAGPLKSRVSGHWVIAIVRPVVRQNRFDGVLYATLDVDHFQKLFARYELDHLDALTLRTLDLELVARHVPGSTVPAAPGSRAVSEELRAAVSVDPNRGVFVARTALDGVPRTTAYRRLQGWPLLVLVGIGNERFFAPWKTHAFHVSMLALLAAALVVFASLWVNRASRQEGRSLRALASATLKTQALLKTAGDGIHIVGLDGRLVGMSDSFAQMLGTTPEKLLGRHISSWDVNQDEERIATWLATVKDGDRQRVDVQHRREDGSVIDVDLQISVADIEGERLIIASARDVTERKRLLREQAAMLDNDIAGMAKLGGRTVLWGNRALDRIFGYGPGELEGKSTRILYPDDASFEAFGEQAYAALAAGGHFRTQWRMKQKNGRMLWVDVSGVDLFDDQSFWLLIDITAMKEAHSSIEHMAYHDAVTQLPNRLLLAERLQKDLQVARDTQTEVAVCYLDLDGFKQVNDAHGHDAGDALLVEIGQRLLAALRGHDLAARVGGDEFVLVLTALASPQDCQVVLQRVLHAIHQPIALADGKTARVGASIGVALAAGDVAEPSRLIELADQAMLRAKRSGKGRIEFCRPGEPC